VRRPTWDERGQVGGVEGLFFGVAVFVLGTLVVANAWGVIDAKMAASSAAREATRSFVESSAGYGRSADKMRFEAEEAELRRCARVTLRVEYPVPLITIPVLGRYGTGFTARARHSEVVDPFRSGLSDRSSCPPALTP
jgi:hypothetical protein